MTNRKYSNLPSSYLQFPLNSTSHAIQMTYLFDFPPPPPPPFHITKSVVNPATMKYKLPIRLCPIDGSYQNDTATGLPANQLISMGSVRLFTGRQNVMPSHSVSPWTKPILHDHTIGWSIINRPANGNPTCMNPRPQHFPTNYYCLVRPI